MEKTHGICLQPYIPVRSEASEKSEMITQLLFGEFFTILIKDSVSHFTKIHADLDGYEGWIDDKTITSLSYPEWEKISLLPSKIVRERYYRVVDKQKHEMWLSAGSILRIEPGNNIHGTLSMFSPEMKKNESRLIMEEASQEWLNVSYLWGGKSTFGTDCSGLVQNICLQAGKIIPRDAHQQATVGKAVNFVFESQPGDLAFFDNEAGEIIHVGMLLSGNQILHASGKVKLDLFDQQGIYSREKGNYTHKLRLMRNVID